MQLLVIGKGECCLALVIICVRKKVDIFYDGKIHFIFQGKWACRWSGKMVILCANGDHLRTES